MLDESSDIVPARSTSSNEAEYESADGEKPDDGDDSYSDLHAQGNSSAGLCVVLIAAGWI